MKVFEVAQSSISDSVMTVNGSDGIFQLHRALQKFTIEIGTAILMDLRISILPKKFHFFGFLFVDRGTTSVFSIIRGLLLKTCKNCVVLFFLHSTIPNKKILPSTLV